MSRRLVVTASLVLVCAVAGCSGQGEDQTVSTPPEATVTGGAPLPPDVDPAKVDVEPVPTAVLPEPEWNDGSRATAVATAEQTVAALVQTSLPPDQWLAGLLPWLEPEEAADWEWVDPANVVGQQVTGPGALVEEVSGFVAVVDVPTDAGPWHVTVATDADGNWLVRDLLPPVGH
jgi:hypothetical protein